MATSDTEMIGFSRAFRGYDPQEVDDYLVRITQYAQQLADRAMSAERMLEQQSAELAEARRRIAADAGGEVPARLAQILSLAEDEAHDIQEHARAQERAITDQAFRNAEATLKEAAAERVAMEERTRQLSVTRDALLADLRSLSTELALAADRHESALTVPEFEAAAEPVEVFDAQADETDAVDLAVEADDDREAVTRVLDVREADAQEQVSAAHD